MSENNRDRNELDAFWDIDRLLPRRSAPARKPPSDVSATEIHVPPRKDDRVSAVSGQPLTKSVRVISGEASLADSVVHYVPPHTPGEVQKEPEPYEEYTTGGSLIHKVQLLDHPTGYRYFEQFVKDAVRLSKQTVKAAQPVPFFSYIPQYDQLNRAQLSWYLYWRSEVRSGRYPRTDYAYVLLYVFELINLPAGEQQAADHAAALADIWLAYRDTFHQLDHYVSEWLCDYCLIHHLDAPSAVLALIADDLTPLGSLKEFYLNHTITGGNDTAARVLLSHCCSYDFRKSKFATGAYRDLFYEKIPATLTAILPHLLGGNGTKPLIHMQDCAVTREAYVGGLCAHMNKRRIKVFYTSFSRSHELRFLVGDIVRHIENRLRGWIGVRSKLSVMTLPSDLRDRIDAYLAPQAPTVTEQARVRTASAPRPAYERQYDLPVSHSVISMEEAKKIEVSSWDTTHVLVDAFDQDEPSVSPQQTPIPASPSVSPQQTPIPASPPDVTNELSVALGEDLTAFVRLALDENVTGQRELARRLGQMPDAIADRINEITCEHVIFDMILEDRDGIWSVIEDYRAAVTEQLNVQS